MQNKLIYLKKKIIYIPQDINNETEITTSEKKLQNKESDKQIQIQKVTSYECDICYQETNNLKILKQCYHAFCINCLRNTINFLLKRGVEEQKALKCPDIDCDKQIDFFTLLEIYKLYHILDSYMSYDTLFSENPLQQTDLFRIMICKTKQCQKIFFYHKSQKKTLFCKWCKSQYDPQTQERKEVLSVKQIQDMAKFRLLYLMRCPACLFWVERTEGCPDMLCNCGFNFCYDCGQNKRRHKYKCDENPDPILKQVKYEMSKILSNLNENDELKLKHEEIKKQKQQRGDFI
ncbi:hypothetical protein PPERSA_06651 [Pseudocohnilembus persalinus]|uniref:RING-type domain-containing protein n=1 Tax=Pseudocohnilembus persalinus TaxID=266149 RepID=A0A0V0QRW6_PSEPJ|nr:hypothetical protein PPERSA_06651 [Pseudocohnilembus persalinus]|eukprot:KRX05017.1 hypothetical protein PPERSA_06651 [Pseudocohnilembus persalinus]